MAGRQPGRQAGEYWHLSTRCPQPVHSWWGGPVQDASGAGSVLADWARRGDDPNTEQVGPGDQGWRTEVVTELRALRRLSM